MSDIRVIDGALNEATCDQLVSLFDRQVSAALPSYVYNESDKDGPRSGTVLILSPSGPQKEIVGAVHRVARDCMEHMTEDHAGLEALTSSKFVLTDPRIECIYPGEGFNWHMDSLQESGDTRFLRFLFYLNDEFADGETEFAYHPFLVKPRKGSLLVFPPYWTHVHRGRSPTGGRKFTLGFFAARSVAKHLMSPPSLQANSPDSFCSEE